MAEENVGIASINTVTKALQGLGYSIEVYYDCIHATIFKDGINIELYLRFIDKPDTIKNVIIYSISVSDEYGIQKIDLTSDWNLYVSIGKTQLSFRYGGELFDTPSYIIISGIFEDEIEKQIKAYLEPKELLKYLEKLVVDEIHEREIYIWQNLTF